MNLVTPGAPAGSVDFVPERLSSFEPSEDQLLYAGAITDLTTDLTGGLRGLAGYLGIEENDIVGWFRDANFMAWLVDYRVAFLASCTDSVHLALAKSALSGKAQSMKLWMERFDEDYIKRSGKGRFLEGGDGDISEDQVIRFLADKCQISIPMVMALLSKNADIVAKK